MRYFKEYDEHGYISVIGAGDALNGVDITKEEYENLLVEIEAKMVYTDQLYRQEITIYDVPEAYREEVQHHVDKMIANFGPYDTAQISDSEAIQIITGGESA